MNRKKATVNSRFSKFKSFTLAEVLITLAIIGIVASITIPSLMQKTQDQELKAAWKKSYADLNQAMTKIVSDNGGSFIGLCPDGSQECFRDLFASQLSYSKKCDGTNYSNNCWHADGVAKWLDGKTLSVNYGVTSIRLNNGVFIGLNYDNPACNVGNENNEGRCGWIAADVNGLKKPNTYGKDIFWVSVLKDKIYPWGASNGTPESLPISQTCNPSYVGHGSDYDRTGWGCAAVYLQQ